MPLLAFHYWKLYSEIFSGVKGYVVGNKNMYP